MRFVYSLLDTNLAHIGGFLEVSDLLNMQTSYLPVPAAKFPSYNTSWLCSLMEAQFVVAPSSNGVVTVDSSGGVRLWETTGVSRTFSGRPPGKRAMEISAQKLFATLYKVFSRRVMAIICHVPFSITIFRQGCDIEKRVGEFCNDWSTFRSS